MICDFCKMPLAPDAANKVAVGDKTYNLCLFDAQKVNDFTEGTRQDMVSNILYGGGRVTWSCIHNLREIIKDYEIKEVLEFGAGLSSEIFVTLGCRLISFDVLEPHVNMLSRHQAMKPLAVFHHYQAGQEPPVEKLYPGRMWDFVFVDGPQRRAPEVRVAMRVARKLIFLHDPNLGEEGFFPGGAWMPTARQGKLFVKNSFDTGHHQQVLKTLKKRFGLERKITGIEIGTLYGDLTKTILSGMANIEKVYTMDPWLHSDTMGHEAERPQAEQDQRKEHAHQALADYGERAQILILKSDDAVDKTPEHVDFVWVDGDHTPAQVARDIKNYLKKIKPGGLFGGHDYHVVKEVLWDLGLAGGLKFGDDTTWWLYVG